MRLDNRSLVVQYAVEARIACGAAAVIIVAYAIVFFATYQDELSKLQKSKQLPAAQVHACRCDCCGKK